MSTAATAANPVFGIGTKLLCVGRAAVLGAGMMGLRLAAHLANAGIPTLLLDPAPKPEGAERRTLARTDCHGEDLRFGSGGAIERLSRGGVAALLRPA
jgi:3-hydroxyacyl-CoA dehydrogenase